MLRERVLLAPGLIVMLSGPTWAAEEGPSLSAGAVVLTDQDGLPLYSRNPRRHQYPASLTKILTAILVIERASLNDSVTVSQRAAAVGQATIWLTPGERIGLGDLLQALLIKSANDAATAAAEHVAGSVEEFVALMNRRAAELGARESHFRNPHGLHDPEHYTTAWDLAILARHGMALPRFRELVRQPEAAIPWPGHDRPRVLRSRNELLGSYPGAIGVKTGYTRAAGLCVVAAAEREGLTLIAVVLDAEDVWDDARALLDWGFRRYKRVHLVRKGGTSTYVPVRGGRRAARAVAAADLYGTVLRGPWPSRILRYEAGQAAAPVRRGQHVGRVVAELPDGRELATDLVAAEAVGYSLWGWLACHKWAGVLLALALWGGGLAAWNASRRCWPVRGSAPGASARRSSPPDA